MCPGSLWQELPIVPEAEQELPSYISTHARSGGLRLANSVAGPRVALLPRPLALFFLFPPSQPSFCQTRRLFYLHSPVASSYMYPALVPACACPQWHAKEQQSPQPLASCPGVRSANRRRQQRPPAVGAP